MNFVLFSDGSECIFAHSSSKPDEFKSKLEELEKQKETERVEAQKQLDEARETAAAVQASQTKPKVQDLYMVCDMLSSF